MAYDTTPDETPARFPGVYIPTSDPDHGAKVQAILGRLSAGANSNPGYLDDAALRRIIGDDAVGFIKAKGWGARS